MTVLNEGNNFPPENPSFFQKAISYALVNMAIVPSIWGFMNILNQTKIVGRRNISKLKPPYILMSNHTTLLDDLFLGPLVFAPNIMKGYRYLPYHAPEERNFYKKHLISLFMKATKSVPVVRGKGIHQEGVNRLIRALKRGGVLHIYPEGTRTRTGKLGKPKSGIGRIVYESGAPVIPMYHAGLEKVLPIGAGLPHIGRKVRVAIGEPLVFDKHLQQSNEPRTWREISSAIMDAIYEQRKVVQDRWGIKNRLTKDTTAN